MTARAVTIALLCLCPLTDGPRAFQDHVFVVTDPNVHDCNSAALEPVAPWTATRDVEPVGGDPVVRHCLGLTYVINRSSGTVQVIDPATCDTKRTFSVGAVQTPRTSWSSTHASPM